MTQVLFFNCTKKTMKNNQCVSVLNNEHNNLISAPLDIVNEFNKYFASIFTAGNDVLSDSPPLPLRSHDELKLILF